MHVNQDKYKKTASIISKQQNRYRKDYFQVQAASYKKKFYCYHSRSRLIFYVQYEKISFQKQNLQFLLKYL
jgi:hypothetical protein